MFMVFYLTLSGTDSKPSIQYFLCKNRKFQHLHYFNKRITECKKRIMEKENNSNDLTNIVTKNGFVIIGVIGEITAEDRLLFPKGNVGSFKKNDWKFILLYVSLLNNIFLFIGKAIKDVETKTHWEAVPVLCFQNNLPVHSALEVHFFHTKQKTYRNL